ncbi:NAD-dependent epimerase/dehydratase family protein [Pseudoalteromonas sp. MMG024]|uniref:NAD-dependent epimerase/dehydratase family protein n=1 Tax=Pseudoalteromonas sp. MMG024 TaxID=2909980 RepID=UPI001F00B73A|nr:NAD-dependent epimerase/dehydratase family protein [Pseudoalteromonas sp. MMG024]MCF6457782.1 NAD-dependent epimerase/dehydratase family protein [Pseudoalteromonas sp. MMG024]
MKYEQFYIKCSFATGEHIDIFCSPVILWKKNYYLGKYVKIFITGVTGYVGRNLAKHFVKEHKVAGLSRDLEKSLSLEELGIGIFKGDLHSSGLEKELKGYDVVIHAAADTDHKNASRSQYDTNVVGTELLLHAAKAAGIKKFIHISTESVLLTGKELHLATENIPYPKVSVGSYSKTKRLAEELALQSSNDEFNVIVLRPRFIWGRDDTTAIPQILKAVNNGQFAWINGGEYKTSTIHIANFCFGVECAISRGNPGEVYFLSDDDDKTFKNMVSSLIEAYGYTSPTKSVPRAMLLFMAKLDNYCRKFFPKIKLLPITMQEYSTSAVEVTLDITKAKEELGYAPVISFQQGLLEITKQTVK